MAIKRRSTAIIIVALIALAAIVAAVVLNIFPELGRRKEVAKRNEAPVSASPTAGPVFSANQSENVPINISSEADLKRFSDQFKPVPPETAPQTHDELSAQAAQTVRGIDQEEPDASAPDNSPPQTTSSPIQSTSEAKQEGTLLPVQKVLETRIEELTRLGYQFSPSNPSLPVSRKSVFKLVLPVSKNIEYVIVTVASPTVGEFRVSIFDEAEKAVTSNLKGTSNQGFYSLRATSSGTIELFLDADQIARPSEILFAVGRRGQEAEGAAGPTSEDSPTPEPTPDQ